MGLGLGRVQSVKQPILGPAPWATVGWVMNRPLRGFPQPKPDPLGKFRTNIKFGRGVDEDSRWVKRTDILPLISSPSFINTCKPHVSRRALTPLDPRSPDTP